MGKNLKNIQILQGMLLFQSALAHLADASLSSNPQINNQQKHHAQITCFWNSYSDSTSSKSCLVVGRLYLM